MWIYAVINPNGVFWSVFERITLGTGLVAQIMDEKTSTLHKSCAGPRKVSRIIKYARGKVFMNPPHRRAHEITLAVDEFRV